MLSSLRALARPIAATVLVAFLALGGVSSALHAPDCHEDECATLVAHDASEHRFQPASGPEGHPLHCVLCHWTRSTRPELQSQPHTAPESPAKVHLDADVTMVVPSPCGPQPPLRSPPFASLA